jgi:uncharacterized protein YcfJ
MRQIIMASALYCLAGLAQAAPDTVTQSDWAPVLSSNPIYQQVNTPRRQCWTEQVTTQASPPAGHDYGGAIIGGIAGGLLGHTLGRGSGRDAATAIGAAAGAIVGDNMADRGDGGPVPQTREEQHCRSVDNWSRQLIGYSVVYRYGGRVYRTELPDDPGYALRVRVSITPIRHATQAGGEPPPPSYPPPPPR